VFEATRIIDIWGAEVGVDEVAKAGMVVAVMHVGHAGLSVVGMAGQTEAECIPQGYRW